MAGKRIFTTRATVDMITAEDIYDSNDHLIIKKGTVLTEDIIEALKDYSVFAIRVEADGSGQAVISDGTQPQEEVVANDTTGDVEDNTAAPEDIRADFVNPYTGTPVTEEERDEYISEMKETPEFKAFHSSFMDSVDDLKDEFNRVVMKNEEVDSEAMLKNVESIAANGRNALHILDMLQCMRGYNDVTYVHSINVALLSNMIGKIIWPDISEEELNVLTMAGLLHDIGKLLVPEEITMKKGRLTLPEYNIAKTHVFHGNNILKNLDLDPRIAEVAMRHHERCDGSGYPGGYNKEQISDFAKIVAIADTYDAMTSDRVYRAAICPFDVIHMFEREGIVKYDVTFLLPFLEKAVQAYINTEVKLTTNEVGKVILINRKEMSKPVVQVGDNFYDLASDNTIGIKKILI